MQIVACIALDRCKDEVTNLGMSQWKRVIQSIKYLFTPTFLYLQLLYNDRGYNIRLFLSGDYELLCALYSYSDSSGMQAELKKGKHTIP